MYIRLPAAAHARARGRLRFDELPHLRRVPGQRAGGLGATAVYSGPSLSYMLPEESAGEEVEVNVVETNGGGGTSLAEQQRTRWAEAAAGQPVPKVQMRATGDIPAFAACPPASAGTSPETWAAEAQRRGDACLCEMRRMLHHITTGHRDWQRLAGPWDRGLRVTEAFLSAERPKAACASASVEAAEARAQAEAAKAQAAAEARAAAEAEAQAAKAQASGSGQEAERWRQEAERARQAAQAAIAEAGRLAEQARAKAEKAGVPSWLLPAAAAGAALLLFSRRK